MLVTKIRLVALCGFIAIISFGIACNGDGEVDLSDDPVLKASEKTLPKENVLVKPKQYSGPPAMAIDPGGQYIATFEMKDGTKFVVELYAKEAPVTVNSFVFLARDGYYDGVTFHRVIPGFMAQGGDPTATGGGGPGYSFENEFSPIRRHDSPGILSMANRGIVNGKATNGSQFFIMYTNDSPRLDGLKVDGSSKDCTRPGESCHSVFGLSPSRLTQISAFSVPWKSVLPPPA